MGEASQRPRQQWRELCEPDRAQLQVPQLQACRGHCSLKRSSPEQDSQAAIATALKWF